MAWTPPSVLGGHLCTIPTCCCHFYCVLCAVRARSTTAVSEGTVSNCYISQVKHQCELVLSGPLLGSRVLPTASSPPNVFSIDH